MRHAPLIEQQLPGDTVAQDAAIPRPEIIHNERTDVIINTDAASAPIAHALAEQFQHEVLPETWQSPMSMRFGRRTVEGQDFFVKIKAGSGERTYRELLDYDQKRLSAGDLNQEEVRNLSSLRRMSNSVLGEIKLAPKVKRLINSQEAQEKAQAFGFKGIQFVEPVLAVVDKGTGRRSVVYDHVDAKSIWNPAIQDKYKLSDGDAIELAQNFRDFFLEHDIVPNDLYARQILADDDANLFLIDMEQYRRKRTESEQKTPHDAPRAGRRVLRAIGKALTKNAG